jgi:hypothetical protein
MNILYTFTFYMMVLTSVIDFPGLPVDNPCTSVQAKPEFQLSLRLRVRVGSYYPDDKFSYDIHQSNPQVFFYDPLL